MGRPTKEPGEKLVEVPCKVSPEVAEAIDQIARRTDRYRSQIARKLIHRGLAAYKRDGNLDEPSEAPPRSIGQKRRDQRRTPPVAYLSSRKEKGDKIDEAIDNALTKGGKPVSDENREIIREALEKLIQKDE